VAAAKCKTTKRVTTTGRSVPWARRRLARAYRARGLLRRSLARCSPPNARTTRSLRGPRRGRGAPAQGVGPDPRRSSIDATWRTSIRTAPMGDAPPDPEKAKLRPTACAVSVSRDPGGEGQPLGRSSLLRLLRRTPSRRCHSGRSGV